MGESIAIVKYFCNDVNTRHLAVPHEQVNKYMKRVILLSETIAIYICLHKMFLLPDE